MPPAATKSENAIFSITVMVKVTRSLNLVSIVRALSVEYHAKFEFSISYGSKVIAKSKSSTEKQTNKQTNEQTGLKQYAPMFRSYDE